IRKLDGEDGYDMRAKKKLDMLSKKETEKVKEWIKETHHELLKFQDTVYAVPGKLLNDLNILSNNLHIIYFGTQVGELIRDKLIPVHALALSPLVGDECERVNVTYEQAIDYLKKKELKNINEGRGWRLVCYENYPLGWINVLPNRINNYYP